MADQRYYTFTGGSPKIEAYMFMSGPQSADQIPEGVKLILDMPGITEVAVLFDHGNGPHIETFRKIVENVV